MNPIPKLSAKPPKFPIKKTLSPRAERANSPNNGLLSAASPLNKRKKSPSNNCICCIGSLKTGLSSLQKSRNLSPVSLLEKNTLTAIGKIKIKAKGQKPSAIRAKSEQKLKRLKKRSENFLCLKRINKEKLLEKKSGKNEEKFNILLRKSSKSRIKFSGFRKQTKERKIKITKCLSHDHKAGKSEKKLGAIERKDKIRVENTFIEEKSAVKIQALFRGYITRKVLNSISKFYKHLEIPSQSHLYHSITSSSPFIQTFLSSAEPSTPSNYSKVFKKDSISADISEILIKKSEIENMKKDDLKLIQEISQKFSYNSHILRVLSGVIERRYEKLNSFFDDWVLRLKENLKYLVKIKESNDSTIKDTFSSIENRKKKNFWVPGEKSELEKWCIRVDCEVSKARAQRLSNEGSKEKSINKLLTVPSTSINGNTSLLELEEPSLEHSEALKDYSSISLFPSADQINEISSLEKDLDLKPPLQMSSFKRSVKMTMFERDSPSNPLIITSYSEKPYDISGENLVVDRVIFILELDIYHEIIENNIEIFTDAEFVVKLIEEFLIKSVMMSIGEALRPRVLRASNQPCVETDTNCLLKVVDQVFMNALNESEKFRRRLENKLRNYEKWMRFSGKKKAFVVDGKVFGGKKGNKLNVYSETHNKAILAACEELVLHNIFLLKNSVFDSVAEKLPNLKLSNIFIAVRDKLSEINGIKAGNLPFGETIRPNGDLDEVKLLQKQKESLDALITEEIRSLNPYWTTLYSQQESLIYDLENQILSDLLQEIFPLHT